MFILPDHVKTIPEIECLDDLKYKLTELASLLEYLLRIIDRDYNPEKSLGELIRLYDYLFSNPKSVSTAVGIRNFKVHGPKSGGRKYSQSEFELAPVLLIQAIEEISNHSNIPREVAYKILHTQKNEEEGIEHYGFLEEERRRKEEELEWQIEYHGRIEEERRRKEEELEWQVEYYGRVEEERRRKEEELEWQALYEKWEEVSRRIEEEELERQRMDEEDEWRRQEEEELELERRRMDEEDEWRRQKEEEESIIYDTDTWERENAYYFTYNRWLELNGISINRDCDKSETESEET